MSRTLIALVALAGFPLLAQSSNPMALLQRAQTAMTENRFADASELYQKAAQWFPAHTLPYVGLARAAAAAGQTERAIGALEQAARLGADIDLSAKWYTSLADSPDTQALRARFARNRIPISRSRVVAALSDRTLIPESVAWDPRDEILYVGSLHRAKIVKVDSEGTESDFAASGLWGVLGMKIDSVRRELWANTCNLGGNPPLENPDPETEGRAAIVRWSLDSGRILARHEPPAGMSICFNDLVLTPSGEVFATSGSDGLWRVSPEGMLDRYASLEGLLNGIAASPGGETLFLADALRGVVAFDVATKELVELSAPGYGLGGIDGLYVHGRSLIAIQNALTGVPPRVLRIRLDSELRRVTAVDVLERNHPLYDVPTCGVIVADELRYVANSQLRSFTDGAIWSMDRLEPTYILGLDLR